MREEEIKCKGAASTEPLSTTILQTGLFAGEQTMFLPAPLQSVHSLLLCLSFSVRKPDCCIAALLLVYIAIVLRDDG